MEKKDGREGGSLKEEGRREVMFLFSADMARTMNAVEKDVLLGDCYVVCRE